MAVRILLGAALSSPSLAGAQAWTEREVVARARESAPAVLVARGEAELAEAAREGAGLWPNPSIAWTRQHVLQAPVSGQDILQLDVPIVLGGRLSADRELARSASHFARAQAELSEREAIAAVVDRFYVALAAQERAALREASLTDLEEALRVLARRAESGAIPGTELARLTLEVELARSRVASDRSEAAAARIELAAAIGAERAPGALEGTLATAELAAVDVEAHAAVQRARDAERAAEDARGAAELAWIPDVTLTGGVDLETDPNLRGGYVVGLRIELPFGSNGQGQRAEARARAALSAALAESLAAALRARIDSSRARLEAARAELARFDAASSESAQILVRGTRASYGEGRATLYELLDAQRAAYEVSVRRLELALEAKRAEVMLRATAGEL